LINELLAAAILSTSFSVRTPNDDTKPLDYEYMIKAEKTEGNFTWLVKKDWERELGEKYIDNVWKFNQNSGILYGGLDYVDKESKDIKYTTYNIGFNHKSGLKIGVSVKDSEPLFSAGFKLKTKKDNIEYNFNLSAKTDFDFNENNNIYNIKSEVKKWFGKFNIFGLYKHEYYNKKEDFQFKVGVGVKL
jgi:hypothetical protein